MENNSDGNFCYIPKTIPATTKKILILAFRNLY